MLFKSLVAGFLALLVLVCITAAIAGENDRLGRQATKLIDSVVEREYRAAHDLLSPEAQEAIPQAELTGWMQALRDVLVSRYGYDFAEKIRFTAVHRFWLPWQSDKGISVSIQAMEEEEGWRGELRHYLGKERPVENPIEDIVTVTRVGSRWRIADIKSIKPPTAATQSRFHATDEGFRFDEFSYTKDITPDERAALREDLSRALAALDADDPDKAKPSLDLPGFLP